MEDIKIRLGNRIRQKRLQKGYSQEKLALMSDLDRTYLPGIENGKRNISITVLEKICEALGLTISDLTKDL